MSSAHKDCKQRIIDANEGDRGYFPHVKDTGSF